MDFKVVNVSRTVVDSLSNDLSRRDQNYKILSKHNKFLSYKISYMFRLIFIALKDGITKC